MNREAEVTLTRTQLYELLAHLVASSEICAVEPCFYGTFRLIDAASRLAGTALESGFSDPWLSELRQEIERKKLLMMSERDAYFAFLPEASRRVAERLLELVASGTHVGR
jgi:hypothetical protein